MSRGRVRLASISALRGATFAPMRAATSIGASPTDVTELRSSRSTSSVCSPNPGTGPRGRASLPSGEPNRRCHRAMRGRAEPFRHFDEGTGCDRLRIVDDVLRGVDRRPPHVVLVEHRRPFVTRPAGEQLVQRGDQVLGVVAAITGGAVAIVVRPALAVDGAKQLRPHAVGLDTEQPEPLLVGRPVHVDHRIRLLGARQRRRRACRAAVGCRGPNRGSRCRCAAATSRRPDPRPCARAATARRGCRPAS